MARVDRKQDLLLHARNAFAKRGYHATNVEDIVKAAGVARGTFYLYFDDKRAIFEEILGRFLARLSLAIVRVDPDDPGRTVSAQIMENLSRIVEVVLTDKATTKILLADAMGVDPAFDRRISTFFDEVLLLLEESLSDGQRLGIVKAGNPRLLAFVVFGALKEVLFQVVVRGAKVPMHAWKEEIFSFLKEGALRLDAPRVRGKRKTKRG